MIALLAPGQGAQTPGMLAPWLEDPVAEETIARWSDAIGLDLRRLGTTAGADEIKDTAVTQPLVVAARCSRPSGWRRGSTCPPPRLSRATPSASSPRPPWRVSCRPTPPSRSPPSAAARWPPRARSSRRA